MTVSLAPPVIRTLPIRNSWIARVQVRQFTDLVNDWTPWVGATDVRVRFSLYSTGYDFNGYPSTLLGPITLTETKDPGWYVGSISADAVTQAFGRMVGQVVYQITEGAYGTYYFGLTTAEPFLVIDPRLPLP